MKRQWLSSIISISIGFCIVAGCKETPTTPPPNNNPVDTTMYLGEWAGFGYNAVQAGGYLRHDTMHVSLTMKTESFYYKLYRDYMEMGSAMSPMPDTILEEGIWSKKGADSLVLTPTEGKCTRWNFDEAKMGPGPCNPPVRLGIAISGNTWNMNMQNIKRPDTTTVVVLKKK